MEQIPTKEELQQAVINKIEKTTGKKLTVEEYEKLDSIKIGWMLGIYKMSAKIGRKGPYQIVYLGSIRYEKALTTTLINKNK